MKNRHKYSIDWFDVIRPAILLRDNYKCTRCGFKHKQAVAIDKTGLKIKICRDEINDFLTSGFKAYLISLQVAHIDQNPSNNDYSNLISLCPPCHLRFDRDHNNFKKICKMKGVRENGIN